MMYRVGDIIEFKGEDLRLLGLEPSKNKSVTISGRITDVDPVASSVTVTYDVATNPAWWRGVEGTP